MTGKDLFEGMSWVDEGFIDEAENAAYPKPRVIPWIRIASVAACLCLILFAMPHLLPEPIPDDPGSTAPIGAATQPQALQPPGSAMDTPGEIPTGEVPAVILLVDEMTKNGFTGTVTQLVDTDIFEIGMELNVVLADGMRHENADGDHPTASDSKTDYSGHYLMVQFIEFDCETGTIVVNLITEVPSEKG